MNQTQKISIFQKMLIWFKAKNQSFSKKRQAFYRARKLVNVPLEAMQNSNSGSLRKENYFQMARSWADDFYTATLASRNRWKAACLWLALPLIFMLLLCVMVLTPSQHLVPLLIHEYDNGLVTVSPLKDHYTPVNQAEVESDIVRYLRFRESYSADTYNYSYRLIHLMSSNEVLEKFEAEQSADNKSSPINVLGENGYRSVKIQNVLFLDNQSQNDEQNHTHRNIAQVDFLLTTVDKRSGKNLTLPLTALIAWQYGNTPQNPEDRWMNWDGFTVTSYTLNQRSS